MRELPILFSAPMVRAILGGRKTVTRRVVKPTYHSIEERDDGSLWPWREDLNRSTDYWYPCPYGQVGDRLWVRETWAEVGSLDPGFVTYRATYPHGLPAGMANVPADIRDAGYRWKPSIHMPRRHSRITLEVTAVRVERLQDISEERARAEGVLLCEGGAFDYSAQDWHQGLSASGSFATLWESINGAGSWAADPWVWVVEFKRIEKELPHGRS